MKVYVVQHVHTFTDESEDVKFIGVYSSQEQAESAVQRLGLQPGFCDALAGFHISEYETNQDHWAEGYITEYGIDNNEERLTELFQNITADILSLQQFDEVVKALLEDTSGEWHSIYKFTKDNIELQRRLALLLEVLNEKDTFIEAFLFCQWTNHPGTSNAAIITFYLEGWLLFQNAIYYNINRFNQ